MTWNISIPDRDAAKEITRLHRRAAQTAFAHIFPAEAPPPPFEEDLANWRHWLGPDRERGRHAYTVLERQRVVGVVLAGPDPGDPTQGHLARLYVEPERWGSGIGTVLHATAVDDLTNRGFPSATLWVLEGNHRARRWYERLGWAETDVRKPVHEPAGIHDRQYRRALAAGRFEPTRLEG